MAYRSNEWTATVRMRREQYVSGGAKSLQGNRKQTVTWRRGELAPQAFRLKTCSAVPLPAQKVWRESISFLETPRDGMEDALKC